MKKIIAVILFAALAVTAFATVSANAAGTFKYAHITASGNDPYATFTFSSEGAHTEIDPETVKWAAIKYRTVTEKDNTGVQLKGQLYVNPAAEPFIPIVYNHTQKWETAIVDLTSVSTKTSLASIWDNSHYSGKTAIRFDPMEPDRDAEDQNNEHNVAVVEPDSVIDIAWIAFFENEADAKAYDGTQNTPYCILLPEDLTAGAGANSIGSVEVLEYTEGEEPAGEDPKAEDPTPASNPKTSDASVVAIAALACIALAGVVVASKRVR
ncbi:MAG: hypothetical protein J5879_08385 [Clostridia bacterium]|nr:hypothetical protein [Clostridia bacterium]